MYRGLFLYVFYPFGAHLVYWVGFVPAMRSSTHLEFWIFVGFRGFWPSSLKLLFFGNSVFFRTLRLGLISAKPYYQNARIDRGVIFGFRRNLRNYCKLPVRSGFLGVSLISVFSLYFINSLGRWISLETGALYCLLGLCLICRVFVLSVGALYSLLGLCIVCRGFVL